MSTEERTCVKMLSSTILLSVLLVTIGRVWAAAILPVVDEWKFVGCYKDGSPRRLQHLGGSSGSRTVGKCLEVCAAGQFILGGLEYGSECYCGNSILYDHGILPESECGMPCSGNSSTTCGGANTIQVYVHRNAAYTTGPGMTVERTNGWVLTGCWKDEKWLQGGQRTLPQWPKVRIRGDQMTVEKCLEGCGASGFTSGGLEYGQECCKW
ncbi:WSC domain-containing protein [Coprinopsis sp. MPI-PUGE-AT-0042]|nr:WSC domain-containing protein [Coprinopsis sp. MPI-PUGE-AT-0042]